MGVEDEDRVRVFEVDGRGCGLGVEFIFCNGGSIFLIGGGGGGKEERLEDEEDGEVSEGEGEEMR